MQGLWVEGVFSFSLSHSLSLSLSSYFFYNFNQNRLKKSLQIWEKLIVSRQTEKLFSDQFQRKGEQRFQKGKFEIEKPFNEMCYRFEKKIRNTMWKDKNRVDLCVPIWNRVQDKLLNKTKIKRGAD